MEIEEKTLEKIKEEGLRIKREVEGRSLIFKWAGGHTINIYNKKGEEIGVMNRGSFKRNTAKIEKVLEGIYNYEFLE